MSLTGEGQRELELQALRLHGHDAVLAAVQRMRPVLQAAPQSATASGRATLEQNLSEWAFSACFHAASMDPTRPRVGWTINLPYRRQGLDVPGSRHGVDNPDNIYRVIALEPGGRYALHGRVCIRRHFAPYLQRHAVALE